MKDNTTKKLILAALLAALTCVATMIIKIPTPLGGYIHAGDVMVGGYMLYEAVFMSFGVAAAANIPMNAVQGVFGAVAGAALYVALSKTNYFKK